MSSILTNIDAQIKYNTGLSDDIYSDVKLECITFINEAFNMYISDTTCIIRADEIQITAGIYGKLLELKSAKSTGYKFIYDGKQLTPEMKKGIVTPKKAKLADITIYKFHFETKQSIDFDIEAKLLGENAVGSYSGTDLIREYVMDAGMGKFVNAIYQNDGFMLGYLINGNISNILNKLNLKINKSYSVKEKIKQVSNTAEFVSNYGNNYSKTLHHIFLNFNNLIQ